jgi:hypothetical protein
MRIDLLSNATAIDKAVKFVDRHGGLINQTNDVTYLRNVCYNK